MSDKNKRTVRRPGERPAPQAPLFDQQTAPIPRQPRRQTGEMQQMVLPLGAVGMEPLHAPEPAPRRRKKAGGRKRPESGPARRRQMTRGEMRRRRRRRRWLAFFFVVFLMAVGFILSVTVLFKVKHIVVENLDKTTPANTGIYTEDAILGALAVPLEENLFGFSAAEKQAEMELQLPYLETIKVRRRLPDTVVVQVAPATESWCAKTDAGWAILSDGLKVLKVQTDQPADLPVITGLGVSEPTAGRFLSLTTEAQSEQIADLMEQLYAQDLAGSCTRIDMGLGTNAYFVYDGRVKVLLGTFNNLDYKLSVAALLLKNESGEYLSSTDRGTLDVSSQLDDSVHRFTFAPGSFEQEESEPPPPDSANSASGSAASGSASAPASGSASGPASASQPSSDSVPASSAPASGSASDSTSQSTSQPEE
ncbi:cell division protein FtsQ/DivIB [Candidatus Allofournierella excrementavium]|uniref:cell division protein FtsQ/DivIB n=1 Tax=Candidatus Allofournierella excrementavium TaxID=2838591 RepID=UPI003AEF325B